MRSPTANHERVTRHRRKLDRQGAKRLEVVVPKDDADLIKAVAAKLRSGGPDADNLRLQTARLVELPEVRSGEDLFAMFQRADGLGVVIDTARARNRGRPHDFE